ncbi:MAG: TAT-variant-translocated molybdopterin oxidoreductase [Chlamydiota bacterium]|nr:TAT-variant-translocated molybdopterin oxidoreductase [Chlamydiota bacterium]
MEEKTTLDFDKLREHLRAGRNEDYWRSLEELSQTDAFKKYVEKEMPQQAAMWDQYISRRHFLQFMGSSLMMVYLSGCARQPDETIVPYAKEPVEMIPGKPLHFATAIPFNGSAEGVLVESQMGRPIKIEGNPSHPGGLGATSATAQASILSLYDPDRAQVVKNQGRISTWDSFFQALYQYLDAEGAKGDGFALLTETVLSPTLAYQLDLLQKKYPLMSLHQYDPLNRDHLRDMALQTFGQDVDLHYKLDRADVLVSFDSDFLFSGQGHVRYAHDFALRRRVEGETSQMNRLYVAETAVSVTGSMADHRLALKSGQIARLAQMIAKELKLPGFQNASDTLDTHEKAWGHALVDDLKKHRGSSVIIAGPSQPPLVHMICHGINDALGNIGSTVFYTRPVSERPVEQRDSMDILIHGIQEGSVKALLILGGNPVYNGPSSFEGALKKLSFSAHLSLYEDETSALCQWQLPDQHYLESWSDARAYDGTASIIQPLIAPLYDGKSSHSLLRSLMRDGIVSDYDLVRAYWRREYLGLDFEHFWRSGLHEGILPGTAFPDIAVQMRSEILLKNLDKVSVAEDQQKQNTTLELVFKPDPSIWDGRFSNNGWLQELPKPITKLTWDNPAMIAPMLAERMGLGSGDIVTLSRLGKTLEIPVWIMPGHANDAISVSLGYGRERAGKIGTGTGFNTYKLRLDSKDWFGNGLQIQKSSGRYPLVSTQEHFKMEGRELYRAGTMDEFIKDPHFAKQAHELKEDESMYPAYRYDANAWGMSINLSACTGCNACVIACQSENNIPVVGKEEVGRGREMHWIRIDRYYQGDPGRPSFHHQPVLCMHCENAPCEPVCPVEATVHSDEGLNEMVYNRCVGTRYCSNNCPYKVRRFNFYQYVDTETESLKLMRNPDVTVRARGVMEKCSFCVQRINLVRIQAKKEDRDIRDGEVVTACQGACPAKAIVFGNLNDPDSEIVKAKKHPTSYAMLAELGTRPRLSYQAKITNPNPILGKDYDA